MHILCIWLHGAASVCILHQRLADAAAGAHCARGVMWASLVVSVAPPLGLPTFGEASVSCPVEGSSSSQTPILDPRKKVVNIIYKSDQKVSPYPEKPACPVPCSRLN